MKGQVVRVQGETFTLATTSKYAPAPRWANHVRMTSTGAFEYLLCPRIQRVWYFDDSAGTYTDGVNVLDADTGTSLTLNSFEATVDFLYVGAKQPFAGLYVDVGNTNSTGSIATVKYRKSDATWASASATDNTASGGATLAQDGTITWAVPTDWADFQVNATDGELVWVRYEAATTLDSSVTILRLIAKPVGTIYAENQGGVGQVVEFDFSTYLVGGIDLQAASGTPTLDVEWLAVR